MKRAVKPYYMKGVRMNFKSFLFVVLLGLSVSAYAMDNNTDTGSTGGSDSGSLDVSEPTMTDWQTR